MQINLQLKDIWIQISNGEQTHLGHNHGHIENLSFIWYIDVDLKLGHRGTVFHSPFDMNETVEMDDVKIGDCILWPSNVFHMQFPSFVAKERIIMSGNITTSL